MLKCERAYREALDVALLAGLRTHGPRRGGVLRDVGPVHPVDVKRQFLELTLLYCREIGAKRSEAHLTLRAALVTRSNGQKLLD